LKGHHIKHINTRRGRGREREGDWLGKKHGFERKLQGMPLTLVLH